MNPTICSSAGQQRTLFGLAGALTLAGAGLGILVSPWFLALPLFVAVNQLAFSALGACPASLILSRLCRAGDTR